jgi:glycosyltransferase involved in cell wall biosynthesis
MLRLSAYTDATAYGGAEESLANLLGVLDSRFEVTVIGVDLDVVERVVRHRPNELGRCIVPPVRNKFDARALGAHVRVFQRLRPAVSHVNLRTPYSCQGGILASFLTPGTKTIAVHHLPLHNHSSFMRWTRHVAAGHFTAHVSVGLRSARLVEEELGLPPGSVRTIHNGVCDLPVDPIRVEHGSPVVGSIGRLVWQKGFDLLVRALALLPSVTLVLVGDGPRRDDLEALAREWGVDDRVQIVGWSDDARRYLPAFDVFVLPSRFEGFPLVVLEAMLARLPVVATRVGSVAEAVADGETGFLVEPGDVHRLVGCVRELLRDASLRERMGERGRAVALRRFSAHTMADAFERLYEAAAG